MHWYLTKDGDEYCMDLFRRHYSYREYADNREQKLFVGPGEKVVLRTWQADAMFVWRNFIKMESTVQYLETSRKQKAAHLFKKRMRLLMRSGLIKGTIPTSMRKKSNQLTLDTVLREPVGDNVE